MDQTARRGEEDWSCTLKMSTIEHTLNNYDLLFRSYLDLLPLNLVFFVLENGNYVPEKNISLAEGTK